MEEEIKKMQQGLHESRIKRLESDIKRCNAFATVSGVVATLSSLIVAGNIVTGNGLEALQIGGSTAAMAAYVLCYSKMSSTYKEEQKSLQEKDPSSPNFIKDRLETLRYQLEIADTSLSMDYLVSGSFFASTLGHVIELLSIPSVPNIVSGITGAALSALVATLYLRLSKTHKIQIAMKKSETQKLEELEELERLAKEPIPELIEQEGVLELEAPQEPQILSEGEMIKRKGGMSATSNAVYKEGPTKIKKNPPKGYLN